MPRTAKVVAFSTTPEMAEEIDLLAAEEGRTRSELIREAIRAYRRSRPGAGASYAAEPSAVYAPPHAGSATSPTPATHSAPASLPGLARVLTARPAIAEACESAGVARLWAFGSAVRDDFDLGVSDFDFMVEFASDATRKPFLGELFDLQDALKGVLGREVDLGEAGGISNPYLRAQIDAEKVLVYEQP